MVVGLDKTDSAFWGARSSHGRRRGWYPSCSHATCPTEAPQPPGAHADYISALHLSICAPGENDLTLCVGSAKVINVLLERGASVNNNDSGRCDSSPPLLRPIVSNSANWLSAAPPFFRRPPLLSAVAGFVRRAGLARQLGRDDISQVMPLHGHTDCLNCAVAHSPTPNNNVCCNARSSPRFLTCSSIAHLCSTCAASRYAHRAAHKVRASC